MNLQPRRIERAVDFFSGGNQQKVLLARCLTRPVDVFVFDEPTVGVDVGTRAAIYAFIRDLCEAGAAIVLISSDLPEILHLSRRVYVFYRGRVQAELSGDADHRGESPPAFLRAGGGVMSRLAGGRNGALGRARPALNPSHPPPFRGRGRWVTAAGFHRRCRRCSKGCNLRPLPLKGGGWEGVELRAARRCAKRPRPADRRKKLMAARTPGSRRRSATSSTGRGRCSSASACSPSCSSSRSSSSPCCRGSSCRRRT